MWKWEKDAFTQIFSGQIFEDLKYVLYQNFMQHFCTIIFVDISEQ